MMLLNNLTECPNCHMSSRLHWAKKNIHRCTSCGLLFKQPFPSRQELLAMYNQSWQEPLARTSLTGGTSVSLASAYTNQLIRTLGLVRMDGLKVLDYGAGRGALLDALSALGAEVYAIEPFGYDYLVGQGYKVYEHLDDVPKYLRFDGIISLDVLEHLETPHEILQKLKRFLRQNGWLHVATPNARSLNAMLTGPAWREAQNPGHLVFFTPSSLEWVLTNCGYKKLQRLRWFVEYDKHPLRKFIHWGLQLFMLDGELRYLAWNI